jgi:hypothetical protein
MQALATWGHPARQWLWVLVLLAARSASAQIVNVQALFEETVPEGPSAGVELSVDWRTGSTNLLVARGMLLGQWRSERHWVLGVVRGEYGFAGEKRIVSKTLEHLRYRHRFLEWLSGEVFLQHEYDEFRRLQLRALLGTGPRFTLWGAEGGNLILGVAGMLEHERLRRDDAPDAGNQATNVRLSSYLLGRLKLMENISLVETLYLQPRVDRPSDLRLLNETLLAVDANKRVVFTVGFILTYDRTPAANVSPVDTQLRTSLGVRL